MYVCMYVHIYLTFTYVHTYKCKYVYLCERIQSSCSLAPLLQTHTHMCKHIRNIHSGLPCLFILPHVSFYFAPKFSPALLLLLHYTISAISKETNRKSNWKWLILSTLSWCRAYVHVHVCVSVREAVTKQKRNTEQKHMVFLRSNFGWLVRKNVNYGTIAGKHGVRMLIQSWVRAGKCIYLMNYHDIIMSCKSDFFKTSFSWFK